MFKYKGVGTSAVLVLASVMLLACSSAGGESSAAPETQDIAYDDFAPVISASGVVIPERWATLSFEPGGRIAKLYVSEGDAVEGGALLARLDDVDQRHVVRQTEATLVTAQAQLKQLRRGAREEDIAAAMAARGAAQAQLQIAEAGLRAAQIDVQMLQADVTAGKISLKIAQTGLQTAHEQVRVAEANLRAAEAGLVSAQGNITVTRANLRATQAQAAEADAGIAAAEAQLALTQAPARDEEIRTARLTMEKAEAVLELAQSEYDKIGWVGGLGATPQALALRDATLDYQMAKTQYDMLVNGARLEEIAVAQAAVDAAKARATAARAQVAVAQAQLAVTTTDAAQARVDIAQTQLEIAQGSLETAQAQVDMAEVQLDVKRQQLARGQVQVEVAQGQVDVARAGLAQAQAQLNKLQNGATTEELAVAEAQVAQAEAALKQAQDALTETELYAPFDGTITNLYVRESEQVVMGMNTPIMVIGELTRLQVETTDLNEVDIARVRVGQPTEITFDALPEKKLTGRVKKIAPRATEEAGGTNFTVWIQFDELDPVLRWDMTAFVDIFVEGE